jgi:CRISPR/Cas system-associated endoribonuclease Cas2
MSKLGRKSTADIYRKEYEERAKRNDDGIYIVCYDFEGKGVNEIPRRFYRKLNALIKATSARRIQNSVLLADKATCEMIERLCREFEASCYVGKLEGDIRMTQKGG